MKVIKKTNWAYRWNNYIEGVVIGVCTKANDSKTLCSFFWRSLWNMVGAPLVWYLIYAAFGLLTVPVLALAFDKNNFEAWEVFTYIPLIGWVCIFLFFFTISVICYTFSYLFTTCKFFISKGSSEENTPREEKEIGVVRQYLIDKKNKMCTLIKFED